MSERFSEDIDITVFRQDLGEPVSIDELEAMTGKKRRAKLDEIRAACQQYLVDDLQPQLVDRFKEATAGHEGDVIWTAVRAWAISDPSDPSVRQPQAAIKTAFVERLRHR